MEAFRSPPAAGHILRPNGEEQGAAQSSYSTEVNLLSFHEHHSRIFGLRAGHSLRGSLRATHGFDVSPQGALTMHDGGKAAVVIVHQTVAGDVPAAKGRGVGGTAGRDAEGVDDASALTLEGDAHQPPALRSDDDVSSGRCIAKGCVERHPRR